MNFTTGYSHMNTRVITTIHRNSTGVMLIYNYNFYWVLSYETSLLIGKGWRISGGLKHDRATKRTNIWMPEWLRMSYEKAAQRFMSQT